MENFPSQGTSGNHTMFYYFLLKITPMMFSGMSIYLGYKLFILGVTGQASISVNSQAVSGQLLNAAPGIFFAVGGMVGLIVSVWKGVKISFDNGGHNFRTNA